jgi:hypothetical protein
VTITKDDAAQALGEIDAAGGRLREMTAYAYAAPYLMTWGVAWLIADLAIQFLPGRAREWVWPVVASVFTVLSIVLTVVQQRRGPKAVMQRPRVRIYGTMAAAVGFCIALILVFWPLAPKQWHSLFGLIVGFTYLMQGIWIGTRLAVLGLLLIALTLVGYFFLPFLGGFLIFMGVVGGGGLFLGGLWLRRI